MVKDAESEESRRRNQRYRMYLMLAAQGATNWVPKLSLASLLPLVVRRPPASPHTPPPPGSLLTKASCPPSVLQTAARGWDDAQRAFLLSAFPPCYLVTMIPVRAAVHQALSGSLAPLTRLRCRGAS